MAAYVVGTVYDITDPASFEEYRQQVGPTIEKYGGKVVMVSEKVEVGDGSWSPIGIIVVEFQSIERVKQWYNSPEYIAAKPKRLKAGNTGVIFADGA